MRSTQTLIVLAAAAAAHAQTSASPTTTLPTPVSTSLHPSVWSSYTSELAVFASVASVYDSLADKTTYWETALAPGYTTLSFHISQWKNWNSIANATPVPSPTIGRKILHGAQTAIPINLSRLSAIKEMVATHSYFPDAAQASFASDIDAQISAGKAQVSVMSALQSEWATWVFVTETGTEETVKTEETKPAETEETKPSETEETKPSETEETKPSETEETKPSETDETKPAETSQQAEDSAAGKFGGVGTVAVVAVAGLAAIFAF